MKRYVVYPGQVWSANDHQLHHISAEALMHLYHVDPAECVVVRAVQDRLGRDLSDLIPLQPDASGRYEIPNGNGQTPDLGHLEADGGGRLIEVSEEVMRELSDDEVLTPDPLGTIREILRGALEPKSDQP